jgi:hypothetical protein
VQLGMSALGQKRTSSHLLDQRHWIFSAGQDACRILGRLSADPLLAFPGLIAAKIFQ